MTREDQTQFKDDQTFLAMEKLEKTKEMSIKYHYKSMKNSDLRGLWKKAGYTNHGNGAGARGKSRIVLSKDSRSCGTSKHAYIRRQHRHPSPEVRSRRSLSNGDIETIPRTHLIPREPPTDSPKSRPVLNVTQPKRKILLTINGEWGVRNSCTMNGLR